MLWSSRYSPRSRATWAARPVSPGRPAAGWCRTARLARRWRASASSSCSSTRSRTSRWPTSSWWPMWAGTPSTVWWCRPNGWSPSTSPTRSPWQPRSRPSSTSCRAAWPPRGSRSPTGRSPAAAPGHQPPYPAPPRSGTCRWRRWARLARTWWPLPTRRRTSQRWTWRSWPRRPAPMSARSRSLSGPDGRLWSTSPSRAASLASDPSAWWCAHWMTHRWRRRSTASRSLPTPPTPLATRSQWSQDPPRRSGRTPRPTAGWWPLRRPTPRPRPEAAASPRSSWS